ncbi:MAG: hypothetical protein LQ337_003315 [Flavoplaca oasis]|nr:MAG: hypothetical protein LQ337_003315 [Flavoplaca oasis]
MAGNALDNAICPVDNEKKGLEQSTRIRIKKDIGAFYRTYRTVIQTTNSDIIKGVADNDNPLLLPSTLLANKIKSGVYLDFTPEQDKKFEREGHLLAADLTQYYKNALISTLLKNQMCYIQCHQKKFWKSDITDFEPEQGKFCRARCWDGASELNVYGISEISYDADTWEVELQAFIKASYDNYETNRFQVNPMLPSADQLFNDELAPTDGVFLPVCDSYLDKPKKKGLSGISCMCGDEMGSETAQFWTAANFDRWAEQKIKTEPDRRMQSGRGPQFLCKNDMSIARTPPVTYFINMCNMGWRWPLLKENTEMLMEGSDLRCEAFKEEVQRFQESSDSDKDINCYMCFKSSQGKAIQFGSESQDTYITNLFWGEPPYNRPEKQNYNFHRACQFWEDNHGSCRK